MCVYQVLDNVVVVVMCSLSSADNVVVVVYQALDNVVVVVTCRKQWVAKEGSPKSRIDSCTFSNERKLVRTEFPTFTVIREKKRT